MRSWHWASSPLQAMTRDNWFVGLPSHDLVSESLPSAAGSMMATVFHRLGPYEILREIGRGGMAVVFLASDTRTDRRVALKLVPEGTDREARDVLEAEQWGAELQQQFCLVSPHVPAVYEHGIESGYFYVAMEYLDGENLSDVITRGPLETDRGGGHRRRALPLPRGCAPLRGGHRRPQPSLAAARRSQAAQRADHGRQSREGAGLRYRESAVAEPEGDAERLRQRRIPLAGTSRIG